MDKHYFCYSKTVQTVGWHLPSSSTCTKCSSRLATRKNFVTMFFGLSIWTKMDTLILRYVFLKLFFFFVQLFFTVQKENYLHDVTEIETLYWRSLLAFDGFYSECNFLPKYDWPLNIQEKWSSQKSFRSGISDITIRRPPLSHQPLFQWRSFEIIRANFREGWTNKKNTI